MPLRQKWLFLCLTILLSELEVKAVDTPNIFTHDQRLAKPIRIALKDTSIASMLPQITKNTGVPLVWDNETLGDLRASIFVQNQPASRVLVYLATCLRLAWRQESDGYRLYCPAAIAREDERLRRIREEAQARQEEKQQQFNEFTTALLRQSHLTDEEVKKLAAKFPHVAKRIEEQPWFVVGLRVATWLTPEQWDKALINRLRLEYEDWTLTGADPDLPAPTLDLKDVSMIEADLKKRGKVPGSIAIQKMPGRSGIRRIFIGIQPDGRLGVTIDYVVADEFGYSKGSIFGTVRERK
jgi:hypothetical protein